jgi:phospholipid/cholesterol/gamma-HCH transport system substrate-binding protein
MELRTSRSQRWAVLIAVVGALALTLALLPRFGGPSLVPHGAPFELRASFADTLGLQPSADVRVRGVEVGDVASLDGAGDQTLVRFRVDDRTRPFMREGTRVRIGQKTPLGEVFVDVIPGRGAPLADGAQVPSTKTVSFGEALRSLGPEGVSDTDGILTALDRSIDRPDALAATVTQARRIATAFRGLATTLHGDEGTIASLVRNTKGAIGTLADHQASIRRIVEDGTVTLNALGANQRGLEDGLAQLAPTTRSATAALAALRPVLRDARPLVDRLIAAAPDVTRALLQLPPVARSARGVLADAPALERAARPVLGAAPSLLNAAGPALRRLSPALANLVPIGRYLAPRINSLVAWFTTTESVGGSSDSTSHWVRFLIFIDPAVLAGLPNAEPGNAYPQPDDALNSRPYTPGSYERLRAYAPGLNHVR